MTIMTSLWLFCAVLLLSPSATVALAVPSYVHLHANSSSGRPLLIVGLQRLHFVASECVWTSSPESAKPSQPDAIEVNLISINRTATRQVVDRAILAIQARAGDSLQGEGPVSLHRHSLCCKMVDLSEQSIVVAKAAGCVWTWLSLLSSLPG